MAPEQWPQPYRYRKCDQERLRWQQLGLYTFNPALNGHALHDLSQLGGALLGEGRGLLLAWSSWPE